MKFLRLQVLTAAITFVFSFPAIAQNLPGSGEGPYTVEKVLTGNTLELSNGEMVVLAGLDVPPMEDGDKARETSKKTGVDVETIRKMGMKSAEFLRDLVKGKQVRVETNGARRDEAGRMIAYMDVFWCGPGCSMLNAPHGTRSYADGTYIPLNAYMIYNGYAEPAVDGQDGKYADLLVRMDEQARGRKRGFWKDAIIGEEHAKNLVRLFIMNNRINVRDREQPSSVEDRSNVWVITFDAPEAPRSFSVHKVDGEVKEL